MSNRLTVPADLKSLIENREQADRRASEEGRTSPDRRAEPVPAADDAPLRAAQPYAIDDVAEVPAELLERRQEGIDREDKRK